MKMIILNGPPGGGKDTFMDLLKAEDGLDTKGKILVPYCYKWTLCEAVGKRYGLPTMAVWDINATRALKELPNEKFGGKSVRQALIYESEEVIKKQYGETGVAIQTFENIKRDYHDFDFDELILLTASGGFNSETTAAFEFFNTTRKDLFIVRIDREGCSYEAVNDSREYLKDPDLAFRNDYTIDDMKVYIPAVQQFIDR